MGRVLVGGFLVAVIVAFVIFYPLGLIWALNTLFGLNIAYTLAT